MSATNKTPNLDLPQWVQGDEIELEDFNAAFDTLDERLASTGWLSATLLNGWVGSVYYKKNGDGTTFVIGRQLDPNVTTATIATLPLGFRPPFNVFGMVRIGNIVPYHYKGAVRVTAAGNIAIMPPAAEDVPNNSNALLEFSVTFDSTLM